MQVDLDRNPDSDKHMQSTKHERNTTGPTILVHNPSATKTRHSSKSKPRQVSVKRQVKKSKKVYLKNVDKLR